MNVLVGLYGTSWPNEKRYRSEILHTYSRWPYLKTGFWFFEEIPGTAASLAKLPCHVYFPHIFSIALSNSIFILILNSMLLPANHSLLRAFSLVKNIHDSWRLDSVINKSLFGLKSIIMLSCSKKVIFKSSCSLEDLDFFYLLLCLRNITRPNKKRYKPRIQ